MYCTWIPWWQIEAWEIVPFIFMVLILWLEAVINGIIDINSMITQCVNPPSWNMHTDGTWGPGIYLFLNMLDSSIILKLVICCKSRCGVNVFIVGLEHTILILSALIQKQAERVVWDGGKILYNVLPWEWAIPTVLVLHEVQTRWKGFPSVSLPLWHFQAAGARTRGDTMGSRHLEL